MKRRIYLSAMLLATAGIMLVSVALCAVFYNQFAALIQADLKQRVQIFADDESSRVQAELALTDPGDMRVTLIAPDGLVTFDNTIGASALSSHLGREEIEEALSFGEGESSRYSETLRSRTYYYALRLADGAILRVSKTISGMWHMFARELPVIGLILFALALLNYFMSKRLARSVVAPLDLADPAKSSSTPYEELAPYVRTIAQHRKQIEQDSLEAAHRSSVTSAIMDNMSEGVLLLDQSGGIVLINRSAAIIFGADGAMEGKSVLELVRDIDLADRIKSACAGQRAELTMRRAGKVYSALISPAPESGTMVLLVDITERDQSEKMRREFSANVSHELKTPLTSIYGHAEMLVGGLVQPGDEGVFFQKIMHEAARLIALIEDIIMLSALDESTRREHAEEFDLASVARECAQALLESASARGIAIHISGDAMMRANRPLIYELLYNLMDNGIKYNKDGGSVTVALSRDHDRVEIAVADNGIGIAPQEADRVFERFYRIDKSRSKKSGGTGLGLAIAKHVALMHGGQIRLDSTPGNGSTFTVTLDGHGG